MPDLQHTHGADLSIGPTGDLASSDGSQWTRERVLRRLLTAPGAYIWQPGYGAGLPSMVGRPVSVAAIGATVRAQMRLERGVAQRPAPAVNVVAQGGGTVAAAITYTDAVAGQPQALNLPLG